METGLGTGYDEIAVVQVGQQDLDFMKDFAKWMKERGLQDITYWSGPSSMPAPLCRSVCP